MGAKEKELQGVSAKRIENPPWLDIRLTKETMDHLWDVINNSSGQIDAKKDLAGNISKSTYIQDKDNWVYENILKEHVEYMSSSLPIHLIFKLEKLWVNYQKQYDFNPPHQHTGAFSFVVFMKIPTHWKEQHALPISANSNWPVASDFQFLLGQPQGQMSWENFLLSSEDEGRMLFFPAWLVHQVFPFYGTEEERITVSGNIIFEVNNEN